MKNSFKHYSVFFVCLFVRQHMKLLVALRVQVWSILYLLRVSKRNWQRPRGDSLKRCLKKLKQHLCFFSALEAAQKEQEAYLELTTMLENMNAKDAGATAVGAAAPSPPAASSQSGEQSQHAGEVAGTRQDFMRAGQAKL